MTTITSVEPTHVDDQLLVVGEVDGKDVQVRVWRSHLYGDQPSLKDRAPKHESNPGPKDPEVPQTDAQRRKYLISELEQAAGRVEADKALDKLVD